MQDHDLLIRVDSKVDNLIVEFQLLRDGNAKRLHDAESRIDNLEKQVLIIQNDIKKVNENSNERYIQNREKISGIELTFTRIFNERTKDNDEKFLQIEKVNSAQSKDIALLLRTMYIVTGFIICLQIIIPIIIKHFNI